MPQVHLISGIFFFYTQAKGKLNARSQSGERRPPREAEEPEFAELRSQGPGKHLFLRIFLRKKIRVLFCFCFFKLRK